MQGDAAEAAVPIERQVAVVDGLDQIRFGRKQGLEVQLPFATVSGLHAFMAWQAVGWVLTDLGSANGTWVGQQRLEPNTPYPVHPGDVFRLADVEIELENDKAPPSAVTAAHVETTATIARRLVSDLFGALSGAEPASIVVESGPAAGTSFPLTLAGRAYRVGRAPTCEIVLPDDDISREHASFQRSWEGVLVRDLGSKNGIDVDGQRVRAPRRLHDGDVAVVGGTRLRLVDPEDRYLRRMQDDAAPASGAVPALPSGLAPLSAPRAPEPPTSAAPRALAIFALLVLVGVLGLAAWLFLATK